MDPVFLTDTARVDDVRKVVFCVRKDKIRVADRIVSVQRSTSSRKRNPCSYFDSLNAHFGSGKANKSAIKVVEPTTQYRWHITSGIRCDENKFDLIDETRWNLLQSRTNIRHMRGALIRQYV